MSWKNKPDMMRVANRNWMRDGVCAGDLHWLAKSIPEQIADCYDCPVMWECLQFAIDTSATEVVMGGVEIGHRPITLVCRVCGRLPGFDGCGCR